MSWFNRVDVRHGDDTGRDRRISNRFWAIDMKAGFPRPSSNAPLFLIRSDEV